MNAWQILGIEPTSDESAIKKAYAKQLKHNKPDKNPEGFKQLREAYEHALATRYYYADDDENEDADEFGESDNDTHGDEGAFDNSTGDESDDKNDELYDEQGDENGNISLIKPYEPNYATPNFGVNTDNAETPIAITFSDHAYTPAHANEYDDDSDDDDENDEHNDLERLSDAWYKIDNSEQTDTNKDEALIALLNAQVEHLVELSLDDRMEYEVLLLEFFAWREDIYHRSYRWVFDNFAWQSIVDSWQIERYPWHRLSELQERYRKSALTLKYTHGSNNSSDSASEFETFLQDEYPTFFEYYKNSHPNKLVHALRFAKRSFYPEKVGVLSYDLHRIRSALNELSTLDNKNDFVFYATLHPSKAHHELYRWTFHGLFRTRVVVMMSVGIWYLAWGTSMALDNMNLVNHHVLPVLMTVGAMMIFWRWRWRLFVYPHQFSYQEYAYQPNAHLLRSLYLSLPIVFASAFYGAYLRFHEGLLTLGDSKMYELPSYFILHAVGFGLWYSLMRANRYPSPFAVQGYWFVVFAFLVMSMLYPAVAQLNGELLKASISGFHPLLWLIIYLPICVHLLAVSTQWSWLHTLSEHTYKLLFGFLGFGVAFVALLTSLGMMFTLPLFGVAVAVSLWLTFKSLTKE